MSTDETQAVVAILIVEDHALTLTLVEMIVSTAFPAHRVLTATSAERALELCAKHAPQIVIMDISLPGIDGIEATRRIKTLLPVTQVVMHSSNDMQVYREGALAAGASAFVSKKSTLAELTPAIKRLLPVTHVAAVDGPADRSV